MATTNAALAEGLEAVKSLVQRVCRSFYDTRQSIMLDQLIKKEAMRDDELAGRVGMASKDLAKIAQPLIADQLVAVYRQLEHKEGAPKAQQRTYYYMDYSHAIDVIKWRMYKIQTVIDDKLRNELDSQGYVCTRCKASFTTLDASFLLDPERNVFVCDQPGCYTELVDNENADEVKGSKDRMSRLIDQTRVIRDLLKRMDGVDLPRFDVMKWLALNGPAGGAEVPDAPKTNAAGMRIELAGDDDEAKMKAKREADAETKRSQNQLPSWIAQSTVASKANTIDPVTSSTLSAHVGGSREVKPLVVVEEPVVSDFDSYYASLEQQGEQEEVVDSKPTPQPVSNQDTPADSSSATATPKIELGSDEEDDFAQIAGDMEKGLADEAETNGHGKRSRDDSVEGGAEGKRSKVDEFSLHDEDSVTGLDEDGDEFEEVEEDSDPNPMISVAGKMLPFDEVKGSDELTGAMTPDEYIVFWDVYQRLG